MLEELQKISITHSVHTCITAHIDHATCTTTIIVANAYNYVTYKQKYIRQSGVSNTPIIQSVLPKIHCKS